METSIEKIPTYALCYLVNGDTECLTDEEIKMINNHLERHNVLHIFPINSDEPLQPYISAYPWFGSQLTEVVDCEVTFRPSQS